MLATDTDKLDVRSARDLEPEAIIVGFGSMGQRHTNNLKQLGITIKAIADPAFTYTKDGLYQDALTCIQENAENRIVVIASPTHLHAQHAIEALYSGAKALYIEKPMCVNLPDAIDIMDISEDEKVPVVVGFNFRAHSGFQGMYKTMRNPNFFFSAYGIDDPTTWPTYKQFGLDSYINSDTGGILWTSTVHAIDMAIAVMGRVQSLIASYTSKQSAIILRMFHTGGGVSTLYNKWKEGHDQTSILSYTSLSNSIVIDLLTKPIPDMHMDFMRAFLQSLEADTQPLLIPTKDEIYHGIEVLVSTEESIQTKEQVYL